MNDDSVNAVLTVIKFVIVNPTIFKALHESSMKGNSLYLTLPACLHRAKIGPIFPNGTRMEPIICRKNINLHIMVLLLLRMSCPFRSSVRKYKVRYQEAKGGRDRENCWVGWSLTGKNLKS